MSIPREWARLQLLDLRKARGRIEETCGSDPNWGIGRTSGIGSSISLLEELEKSERKKEREGQCHGEPACQGARSK